MTGPEAGAHPQFGEPSAAHYIPRFIESLALSLHPTIESWFASKGWAPREHQLAVLGSWDANASALLIAPTGAGKTLAGFLPTLNDLAHNPAEGLHTLYISPLKALAVDVARNLTTPIAEMKLPVTVA